MARTLRINDRGNEVRTLQEMLHLPIDGCFGPITKQAVITFQNAHALVADGIVGPATWAALEKHEQGECHQNKTPKSQNTYIKSRRKINRIILHCTATPDGKDYTVDTIRGWHKNQGWKDIGYHYVITRDGVIHTGRDIHEAGAHTTGYNANSIGIVYVGGLKTDGKTAMDTRTPEQRKALISIVRDLMALYNLNLQNVHCHNEYANKACPSFKIDTFRREFAD